MDVTEALLEAADEVVRARTDAKTEERLWGAATSTDASTRSIHRR
jgi:hypothetical protein